MKQTSWLRKRVRSFEKPFHGWYFFFYYHYLKKNYQYIKHQIYWIYIRFV